MAKVLRNMETFTKLASATLLVYDLFYEELLYNTTLVKAIIKPRPGVSLLPLKCFICDGVATSTGRGDFILSVNTKNTEAIYG